MRPMARYARTHRQRVGLRNAIFCFDRPMTNLALHTSRHVATVIEYSVIGQVIYFYPLDWFVLLECVSDLLNFRRIFSDLLVAIHARAGRRNTGNCRFVRCRMTVKALNLVVAGVHLVREVDRLSGLIALLIAKAAKHGALPDHRNADDGYHNRDCCSRS